MKKGFLFVSFLLASALFCGCSENAGTTAVAVAAAAPTPSATMATTSIKTAAAVDPTPSPISQPPTATPLPTPFSMVWLSDTQMMSYRYPRAMSAIGSWIAENRESENICYVLQTGDAVENGFNPKQWDHFDLCYSQFADNIPYFPIAGNHDIALNHHDYTAFLSRPYDIFQNQEQLFEGGKALYAKVNAGGMELLILGAGWEAEESAIDWMSDVLTQNADIPAILLFHGYTQAKGRFTVVGKKMFEQVVVPHANVRLVLCGHVPGCGGRIDEIDDDGDGAPDRTVHALLYDFQDYTEDCGQIRVLTFDPRNRSLRVVTFSPFTGRYFRDPLFHGSDFTIEHAF